MDGESVPGLLLHALLHAVKRRITPLYTAWKMEEPLDDGINTRVPHRVRQALEDVAKDRGVNPLSFARTLLDEGLRRERHPGIVFRDGPAGRRAAIEGRRLDVWQVMETLWGSEGDIGDAAKYLGLRAEQVQAAVGYYSEFSDEVNSWIKRNREEAERLQERWKKEQAALRR